MTSDGRLSGRDLALLETILGAAHQLDELLSSGADSTAARARLREKIASCRHAKAPALARLAALGEGVPLESAFTAKQLISVIVPFERLRGRGVQDDEIIISATDNSISPRMTMPAVVVADHLRSAFNVGAILRTAEAFGFAHAYLTGYTPTPDESKTARTSMGADQVLPWTYQADTKDCLKDLKAQGFAIVALETAEPATAIGEFSWPEKCAILLGNERFGIEAELLAQADHVLRIPLYGQKNSLNVGIAFGIAAHCCRDALARKSITGPSERLLPIGTLRAAAVQPFEAPRQAAVQESAALARIELQANRNFEQALEDLDGFSRVWLIYDFHHNRHWKPKVVPPRGPRQKRGVFATRSPYRPNPIGLSCVELVEINGRTLTVRGFDLLDGTPIYDIKPYLPYADSFPTAAAGWTEALDAARYGVRFLPLAEEQLIFLQLRDGRMLREFLLQQLAHDPLDHERKRVTDIGETSATICFRTWRAHFTFEPDARLITVCTITSGYRAHELAMPPAPEDPTQSDPHGDKALHREFNARFAMSAAT